jgi:hypothetical protein
MRKSPKFPPGFRTFRCKPSQASLHRPSVTNRESSNS